MKKKHRDIIVNEEAYAWRMTGHNHDNGGAYVRIWKSNKIIYDGVLKDTLSVTPKDVADIINNL